MTGVCRMVTSLELSRRKEVDHDSIQAEPVSSSIGYDCATNATLNMKGNFRRSQNFLNARTSVCGV